MTSLSLPPSRCALPPDGFETTPVVLRDVRGERMGLGVQVAPRLLLTVRAALPNGAGSADGVGVESNTFCVEVGRGLVVVGLESPLSHTARLASGELRPRVGDVVTVAGREHGVVDVDDAVLRHLGDSEPDPGTPVLDRHGVVVGIQSAPTIATFGDGTVVGEALCVHAVCDRLRAVRHRLDDDARALVDGLLGSDDRVGLPREIAVRLGSGWVLPKSLRRLTR
jgi:hypothetical protein